jgi:hypothetical protein
MSADIKTGNAAPSAKVPMIQFVNSYRLGQLLSVVARLGIADLLSNGPLSVEQLAERTGTVAPCLYRVLRALAGIEVFQELEPGTFALTPLAATLRSDAIVSLRGAAAMLGCDWHWRAWSGLAHSVRTGKPAFDDIFGLEFDAALERDPEMSATFDQATVDLEKLALASIRAAYRFDDIETLVDMESAGGFGGLLLSLLEDNPRLLGVFVDKESVVRRAQQHVAARGLSARCECLAWTPDALLPAGGDVYLLRNVLRDYDDAGAQHVLTRCREVMTARSRLLIVEMVVAPGNELSMGKLIDIDALLFTKHGRERALGEYRSLLADAGFSITRVIPTPGPLTLIEDQPGIGETP